MPIWGVTNGTVSGRPRLDCMEAKQGHEMNAVAYGRHVNRTRFEFLVWIFVLKILGSAHVSVPYVVFAKSLNVHVQSNN